MIVVLADDLSGAAELAGAALARGLEVEVQTRFTPDTAAQVVCVDTDTRSLSPDRAAATVGEVARAVVALHPDWLYKKCDSVLRGHVLAELRAILRATGQDRATLVSANPGRGRVLRDGAYFIDGRPLSETAFGSDPEHPRRTSRVRELLGGDLAGIHTPDATTAADLARHATGLTRTALPAGGVEFFDAVLAARLPRVVAAAPRATSHPPPAGASRAPLLLVCGSAAAWGQGRARQCADRGVRVEPMPPELFMPEVTTPGIDRWAAQIARALQAGQSVMAAIGRGTLETAVAPAQLAERLATTVARAMTMAMVPVAELGAEGGATAATLARTLGWTRFAVAGQLAGGVVRLHPRAIGAPPFTIKVGSYDWPREFWP